MPKSGEKIKSIEDFRQLLLRSDTVRIEGIKCLRIKPDKSSKLWKNKVNFKIYSVYEI